MGQLQKPWVWSPGAAKLPQEGLGAAPGEGGHSHSSAIKLKSAKGSVCLASVPNARQRWVSQCPASAHPEQSPGSLGHSGPPPCPLDGAALTKLSVSGSSQKNGLPSFSCFLTKFSMSTSKLADVVPSEPCVDCSHFSKSRANSGNSGCLWGQRTSVLFPGGCGLSVLSWDTRGRLSHVEYSDLDDHCHVPDTVIPPQDGLPDLRSLLHTPAQHQPRPLPTAAYRILAHVSLFY